MRKLEFHFIRFRRSKLNRFQIELKISEYKKLAYDCLGEVPEYQCLKYNKDLFDKLIIVEARLDGDLVGMISSILIDLGQEEKVIHLGLTLVSPSTRGLGITHKLTSKLLANYIFRTLSFKKIWITNVACVFSSLGNVSKHFQSVYPSPFMKSSPPQKYLQIAHLIDREYREHIYIDKNANFNAKSFVFENSVLGNMFEKDPFDSRYLHRDESLNKFYRNRLDFSNGDDQLQVGYISVIEFPIYFLKRIQTIIKKFFNNLVEA